MTYRLMYSPLMFVCSRILAKKKVQRLLKWLRHAFYIQRYKYRVRKQYRRRQLGEVLNTTVFFFLFFFLRRREMGEGIARVTTALGYERHIMTALCQADCRVSQDS